MVMNQKTAGIPRRTKIAGGLMWGGAAGLAVALIGALVGGGHQPAGSVEIAGVAGYYLGNILGAALLGAAFVAIRNMALK